MEKSEQRKGCFNWNTLKENYLFIILSLFSVMIISLCFQDTINFDEYFSMQWCRMGWKDLMQCLIDDVHPPLYYLLLKPIVDLTNENMFCARLLSAIAGIALLWIGSLFLEHNFGKKSALFFSCFLYLNPFMIQKVTEIRMYMLASTFTVISGIISYHILKAPKRKAWLLFTLFSLLAAYTHYYALLCMVFLYAGILIYFIFTHAWKNVVNWLLCSLATVIGYLPWLPAAWKQVTSVNGDYWISVPSSRLTPLKELFYTMIPYTEYIYLGIIAWLSVMALLLFVKKITYTSYWALMCIGALWGIFLFTTWYSMHIKPILLSRYLIMAVCLSILGVSSVARYLNKYILAILCLFCIIIGGGRCLGTIESQSNHNTTKTVVFANENFAEGDILLYNNVIADNVYFFNCLSYYFPDINCTPVETSQISELEKDLLKSDMLESGESIWFLDTSHAMQENAAGMGSFTIEACGSYGFSAMTFEIYKITYVD